MAYLNKEGLAHFWANLKEKFYTKSEVDSKLEDYYTAEETEQLVNFVVSNLPSGTNYKDAKGVEF